ncbi:MAG: polyketide synthase, partial [Methylovulum sp.]
LANRLNRFYGLELMPTVFFAHSDLSALTAFLLKQHSPALRLQHQAHEQIIEQRGAATADKSGPDIAAKAAYLPEDAGAAEPIAVIGMSGRFPGSANLDEFWQHLVSGADLITEVPHQRWDWREYYGDGRIDSDDGRLPENGKTRVKSGGFINDIDCFDPLFFGISPREAEVMDPQFRLFLETVWETIEDAGYPADALSGTKTGVFVGVTNRDYQELLQQADPGGQNPVLTFNFTVANRVSYLLNLRGPSEPIDTACSSSLVAVNRAVESIRQGGCDMALVGGVNLMLTPTITIIADQAGMLSEDGRCKTFDQSADGYGRGEGVGAILLKPLHKALADGDAIYGLIRGNAENHGGRATSPTAPNPVAQQELLIEAYRNAGIDPASLGYIEAHGTGTPLGDPIEVDGLKGAFEALYGFQGKPQPKQPHCGLGTVKTNIGHLEAAS